MKAAVYYQTGGPEVFRYEDVPDPVCTEQDVVIEVQAVSIEGGDTLHRAGGELANRPHIVGYQCAGVIRELGTAVSDRAIGDRVVAVMGHGSHAERVATPAAATWQIPDGLDLEAGACVPIPFGTADDCLFEFGRLQKGESVLIHAGAGGVGIAAIQLAHQVGATVLCTASSTTKLERLEDFGLDHGINYAECDFVSAVRELTGGRGVDLVVDSIGGQTLQQSLEAASYRGRVISVGSAGRDATDRIDPSPLRMQNKSLTGVFLGIELALRPERVRAMIQKHLEAMAAGELRMPIDSRFPLREAAAAHSHIESRKAFGRVLLNP